MDKIDQHRTYLGNQLKSLETLNLKDITDIKLKNTPQPQLIDEIKRLKNERKEYIKLIPLSIQITKDLESSISQYSTLKRMLDSAQTTTTQQQSKILELNTKINSLDDELTIKKTLSASEEQDCAKKITEATDGLKAELADVKAKLQEAIDANSQKDADLKRIHDLNKEKDTVIEQVRKDIASKDDINAALEAKKLEAEALCLLQDEETSSLEKKIKSLEANLGSQQFEKTKVTNDLVTKTQELTDANINIKSKDERIAFMEKQLAVLTTEVDSIKTKLNLSEAAKESLQKQLNEMTANRSANDSALQQELDKKIQELADEKAKLDANQLLLAETEAKLAKAEAEIIELEKEVADQTRDTEANFQATKQDLKQRLKDVYEELAVKDKALTDATADKKAKMEKCESDLIESQTLQQQQLKKLFKLEEHVKSLDPINKELSREVTDLTNKLQQEHTKNKENQSALTTQIALLKENIATIGEEKTSLEAQIIKKDEEIKKLKPPEANEELVKIIQKYMKENKITDDGDSEKRTRFLDSLKKKIDNKKQGGSLNNNELYANLKNSLASKSSAEKKIILDYIENKMRNIK
jgi:chromosome segregation ATPase